MASPLLSFSVRDKTVENCFLDLSSVETLKRKLSFDTAV